MMGALGDELKGLISDLYSNTLISGLAVAQSVTLVRDSAGGDYNPATGSVPAGTLSETRKAIPRDYTVEELGRAGGLINQGDMEIKIQAETGKSVPAIDDKIQIGARTLRIVRITEKKIDGAVVQYVCHCGK
jgi:hypothetical protein